MIISIAPLLSFVVLAYIFYYTGIIEYSNGVSFHLPNKPLYIYIAMPVISVYLLWAGTLSRVDIKGALKGFFSIQTFSIILLIITITNYAIETKFNLKKLQKQTEKIINFISKISH